MGVPDTEIEAMYSNKWRERERGWERYSLHRLIPSMIWVIVDHFLVIWYMQIMCNHMGQRIGNFQDIKNWRKPRFKAQGLCIRDGSKNGTRARASTSLDGRRQGWCESCEMVPRCGLALSCLSESPWHWDFWVLTLLLLYLLIFLAFCVCIYCTFWDCSKASASLSLKVCRECQPLRSWWGTVGELDITFLLWGRPLITGLVFSGLSLGCITPGTHPGFGWNLHGCFRKSPWDTQSIPHQHIQAGSNSCPLRGPLTVDGYGPTERHVSWDASQLQRRVS